MDNNEQQKNLIKKIKIKMWVGLVLIIIVGLAIAIYFVFINPIESDDGNIINYNPICGDHICEEIEKKCTPSCPTCEDCGLNYCPLDCDEEIINTNTNLNTNTATNVNDCEWRPNYQNYGMCDAQLGCYFNGETCVCSSGCDRKGDVFPFDSVRSCLNACGEKKEEKNCNNDEDCVLRTCQGCVSVEYNESGPPDLPCMDYRQEGYRCECVNNQCLEIEE